MKAYTYSIKHLPSNTYYYGVRKSNTEDIGISYFSSSKLVKRMLKDEPIENFEFKVRKRFACYEEARLHETKLLKRVVAVTNPNMLNQAVSSPRVSSKDSVIEHNRRIAISKRMNELWNTPEYKQNQSFNKLDRDERVARGKAGALKRAANYAAGITPKKPKTTYYKEVEIIKDNVIKLVKSNQVPAYAKNGWIRKPP